MPGQRLLGHLDVIGFMRGNAVIDYYRKHFTNERVKSDRLNYLKAQYGECFDGECFVFDVCETCGSGDEKR